MTKYEVRDTLDASSPGPDDIRAQLERILASSEFDASDRIRRFLSYVINQALTGQSDRIKAYVVATEVFGRGSNFDVQNDPIVRIEAGRLRRALERYYLVAGHDDAVIIDIPKGSYVPKFNWRAETARSFATSAPERSTVILSSGAFRSVVRMQRTALVALVILVCGAVLTWWSKHKPDNANEQAREPEGPSLIVKPFTNLSGDGAASLFAVGVVDELLTQLAPFKELRVLGRETSNSLSSNAPTAPTRQQIGAPYVLEGSVRISDRWLRVTSRLFDGETSQVLWSQTYDNDLRAASWGQIEADIAAKVATAVAQPYGTIFTSSHRHANSRTPDSQYAYGCLLRFYHYRTVLNRAEHGAARDCLERTTERFPDYSTGWAMLSYLYLDEDRFDLNRRDEVPNPIARAREAAERAVRLDPRNVRGLQALMTVLFFNREPGEALRVGEQALALNPNDTELLGELGSRIAQAGDWKRGEAMLEQALARNPGHSGYYVGMLALAAYMQNDNSRAVELIRRADLKHFSIYHIVAALIFSRAGFVAEANEWRAQFMRLRPNFFDDFDGELAKRNFNNRDRAILAEGARKAGFPVGEGTSLKGQILSPP